MNLRNKLTLLNQMESTALEIGFDVCFPILARDIILDERVRMHCQLNLCGNYGKNLMCPPFLPPLAETRQIVNSYTFALLLQLQRMLEQDNKEYMRDQFNITALKFNQMAVALERNAFSSGFRLAMALGAGECKICSPCVVQNGSQQCINPGSPRPSMEGMGIDVMKTFRSAGIVMDFKPGELTVAGLLLVD